MSAWLKIGLAIVAAIVTVSSCTIAQRIDKDRDQWRENARQWKTNSAAWKGRYVAEADRRSKDSAQAVAAVSALRTACAAEVQSARQSQRAINRVLAKPVRYDAQNCPIRGRVSTGELAAILTPGVR